MERARRVLLQALVQALQPGACAVIGNQEQTISGLAIDSRRVEKGSLFVALRGSHSDGHRFIAEAVRAGAAAVIAEDSGALPPGTAGAIVRDSARALSQIADAFYGFPSRDTSVIGVTGTNGKTTTTQMIAAILQAGGIACGTIGTIGARFAGIDRPLGNTTPLASDLHELLAEMAASGARAVAMEVSSHALALQRVADVRFRVAALTNITRDHLDFHATFEAYVLAKRRLFEMAPTVVLNVDDENGCRWAREFGEAKTMATYALDAPAQLRPERIETRADGSSFDLDGRRFAIRLPGRFNVANALCAIAVARTFDVTDAAAARGLLTLERVPGRMDHLRGGGLDVVIDYAHTPDALENVLRALRETTERRLLLVFGCGGDRDRGKRPLMGAIAARYADFAYITSDNPRTEDPQSIVGEIERGFGSAVHAAELDRRSAITRAVNDARPGDVVLIAGKGHEAYQIVGTEALPFDDRAVAEAALLTRGRNPQ